MADAKKENAKIEWRESGITLQEQNLHMLEHGIGTDCVFIVGSDNDDEPDSSQEFKAHRLHLLRASPVFETMLLQCQMSEAITGRVRVTDLTPRTFHLLLRLVYGASVDELTLNETRDVALAAHKYQMKVEYDTCMTRLCKEVSTETVWSSLEFAQLLQHQGLLNTSITILKQDTFKIMSTKNFLQLPEDYVDLLLQQDELNVESEMVLVSATVNWARCEAQRRGLPGDDASVREVLRPRLLKLLRLLALSPEQFALGPGLSEWLTDEEKERICSFRQNLDSLTLPVHFSCTRASRIKPVLVLKGIVHVCPPKPSGEDYRNYLMLGDKFIISADFPVNLTEIVLYSQKSPTDKHHLHLATNKSSYKEKIGIEIEKNRLNERLKFVYCEETSYNSTMKIKLPKYYQIAENNDAKIYLTLHKSGTYPTAKWPVARVGDVDIKIKTLFPDNTVNIYYPEVVVHAMVLSLVPGQNVKFF